MEDTVLNLIGVIRDIVNDSYIKNILYNGENWNKVCSAWDVIEDLQLAKKTPSKININEYNEYDSYFIIHGKILCLAEQTYIVEALHSYVLNGSTPIVSIETEPPDCIVELNFLHTEKDNYVINRFTMQPNKFSYRDIKEPIYEINYVDLDKMEEEQEAYIINVLSEFIIKLRIYMVDIEISFSHKKLVDFIPPDYIINKIHECYSLGGYKFNNIALSLKLCESVLSDLNNLIDELKNRMLYDLSGVRFNADNTMKFLNYLHSILKKCKDNPELYNILDLEAYITTYETYLLDLKVCMEELDNDTVDGI